MKYIPQIIVASAFAAHCSFANLVFQADFNGSGTGTGGASDIVSLGGTGALYSHSGSNVGVSVATSTPLTMGGGGYMSLNDMGQETSSGRSAGVNFSPSSAATSLDVWYTDGGIANYDTLNGGFDFFFRTNNPNVLPGSFRFLDVNGGTGGLRLIFNSLTDGSLQLNLNGVVGATSGAISWEAGTTYHTAVTFSTDSENGLVTASLYLATGNTEIDTSSSTHLIASATSSNPIDSPENNTITHSFNSASGYLLGMRNNSVDDVKVLDIDSYRNYNEVPDVFTAVVPENSYFSLLAALFVAFATYYFRRRS